MQNIQFTGILLNALKYGLKSNNRKLGAYLETRSTLLLLGMILAGILAWTGSRFLVDGRRRVLGQVLSLGHITEKKQESFNNKLQKSNN